MPPPAPTGIALGVTHDLSAPERMVLQEYFGQVSLAKARIYDLQIELERANKGLDKANNNFEGALTSVIGAHGMKRANVTPDFLKITAV